MLSFSILHSFSQLCVVEADKYDLVILELIIVSSPAPSMGGLFGIKLTGLFDSLLEGEPKSSQGFFLTCEYICEEIWSVFFAGIRMISLLSMIFGVNRSVSLS